MANSRMNYKAKYLAALNNQAETPSTISSKAVNIANGVGGANTSTLLELGNVQSTMIEAANSARRVCALMDETRYIGPLDFGEVHHIIDTKLGAMKLNIMARRIRDVLQLAEARIGVLSAMCADQSDSLNQIVENLNIVETHSTVLQEKSLDTLFIGRNATEDERDDLMRTNSASSFDRFDIEYHGIDIELEGLPLTANSVLRINHRRNDSGVDTRDTQEADSDSDDEALPTQAQTVALRNRNTVVAQRSATNHTIAM